jgi:hypothetical protein
MNGQVVALLLAAGPALAAAPRLERPMIFSVNPAGDADAIGAPHTGSSFVDYEELLWQRIGEAGSRSARVLASWREVEAVRGQWNWSDLDDEVATCDRHDIEPVALICNIPGWASPTSKPAHDYPPRPENLPDFEGFLTRLAQRYKGRIRYYEFWNEQNGYGWHVDTVDGRPQFNRVDEYVPLLHRAYKAIKAADPDALVGMGGLDDAGGNAPLFVEMAYKMRQERFRGEKCWDAITDHPYNSRPSDVVAPLKAKLDRIRQVAARYGDKDIPLWITEYGWNANREGINRAVQAWGVWGFLETFDRRDQRDLLIAQYISIADFEPVHEGYGLCNLNLKPAPAYREFQRLARADVPQVEDFEYALTGADTLRISGDLTFWPLRENTRGFVQVIDEQGKIRSRVDITSASFDLEAPNLPADEPLLAELRYLGVGDKPQQPIARLPIVRPGRAMPANGGFEMLFRAGVPWGWTSTGEAILRDTQALGRDYQHGGANSVMLMVFPNHRDYRFADRLEMPVRSARGQRFKATCFARLFSEESREAAVSVRMGFAGADDAPAGDASGTRVTKEWSAVEAELVAPCDAPVFSISVSSDRLPESGKRRSWMVCVDDVTVSGTPIEKPESRKR